MSLQKIKRKSKEFFREINWICQNSLKMKINLLKEFLMNIYKILKELNRKLGFLQWKLRVSSNLFSKETLISKYLEI